MNEDRITETELQSLTEAEREALGVDTGATDHAAPGSETTPVPGPHFVPEYTGPSLQDLKSQFEALDHKLEEGDIDIIEYNQQRDPLLQLRFEATLTERAREGLWKQEQAQFFGSHPEYREDPVLNGALRRAFESLDTPENAHRSGAELLNEAARRVKASAERALREQYGVQPHGRDATAGGRSDFDYLDRLEGAAFEKALSRLSRDDEERYLRSR